MMNPQMRTWLIVFFIVAIITILSQTRYFFQPAPICPTLPPTEHRSPSPSLSSPSSPDSSSSSSSDSPSNSNSLSCPTIPPSSPSPSSSSSSSSSRTPFYTGLRTKLPTQFSSSFKKAISEHEQRQKDTLSGGKKSKWVVANTESSGLCNRLQSLASGFLLALLTERAFAVHWSAGTGGINANVNNEGTLTMIPIDEFFVAPFDWRASNAQGSRIAFNGNWGSGDLQEFLCEDMNVKYPQDVIEVVAWDYYVPFLAHNPLYRDKLVKWFGSLDNIYGPILRYLAKLQPSIQKEVDAFVEKNFRTYTVGVHLRMTGNLNYKMEKQHESAAWQCAGVPFGDSVNPAGIVSFPGFDENGDFISLAASEISLFLAADEQKTVQAAKEKYKDRLITYESSSPIGRGTKEAIIRGAIDLYILAQSDDIVTSFQSSYGRAAAAIGGIVPLQITHEAKCVREVSPEPCACGWRKIAEMKCYNSTIHDTPYTVNQVGCSTCDGTTRFREGALN